MTRTSRSHLPDQRAAGWRGPVAIFDLDRTILPGSSLPIVARALVNYGLLPRRTLVEAAIRNVVFQRNGASASTVARLVTDVLELAAGLPVIDLLPVMDGLRQDLVRASRPELRRRIMRHRANGDYCVVLTASPIEVAQLVAEGLGADEGIGTSAEVSDGRFTGKLVGPVCHGTGKLAALEVAAVFPAWERSWAYSDSASDLPLLFSVAHPVAVSPDRALRRVARAQHWPVLEMPPRHARRWRR